MKTISEIKQNILNDHLKTIGTNMKMLSENKAIVQYLDELTNNPSDDSNVKNKSNAFDAIHNYQENFWGKLHHIFIVDVNGKVILSPPHGNSTGSHMDQDISSSKYLSSALKSPTTTDFFGFSEKTHFHQLYTGMA